MKQPNERRITLANRYRRALALLLPVAAAIMGALPAVVAPAQTMAGCRPNLLFIMTDDQGPWTLSVEGHPNAFTPELDKLAAQGALLKNAFAVAAVCSPSRGALITSRYPSETGVEDWIPKDSPIGLDPALTTWPQVLRDAGYQTALVGKWHLGHRTEEFLPKHRGYARFSGYPVGGKRSKDPRIQVEGAWKSFEGR